MHKENVSLQLPIVIVGAGTMGLFLAHELMQRGKRIILIEAGNDSMQSFHVSEYANVGHKHNGISLGRSKAIGGTTNLWGGQLAEFVEQDIESGSDFNQPAWPLSWDELKTYYPFVYKKLGLKPDWDDVEQSPSLDNSSSNLEVFYTRWLKQPNFKFHFLEDLEKSPNVKIYRDAVVTNIEFDGGRCISIDVSDKHTLIKIDQFHELVLANGTFEICRLLLQMQKKRNCPFSENENIGHYFQDHITLRVGKLNNKSKKLFSSFSNVMLDGEKLQPKIRHRKDIKKSKYLGISGYFSFDSNVSQHLDNFKQFSRAVLGQSHHKKSVFDILKMFSRLFVASPQILLIIYTYLKHNRIYVPFSSSVTLNLQIQQITIKGSQIKISDTESDIFGRPKMILDWKIDGREFLVIRDFCLQVKEYLKENEIGELQFEEWFQREMVSSKGEWQTEISDIYHQAGGAIMSESKSLGVVDKNCKVHNVSNLYLAGAVVMPTSGYANTTLTSLALTYRLADFIKPQKNDY